MASLDLDAALTALPKAELHLHLEGSISPVTAAELARRHGVEVSPEAVAAKYNYDDFVGFLEAFKWVTAFVQGPEDFALIADRHFEQLIRQHVVYAEVTLSIGVMLLRKQDVAANFRALADAADRARRRGLRIAWVFDLARQFGVAQGLEVARWAVRFKDESVVALGMGGDELFLPAEAFRGAFELAANHALHRVVHAGEIGGPEEIRAVIANLGAERIGHGIAALHDPELGDELRQRGIALENCPTSNLRTGALARQLGRNAAALDQHPLPGFLRSGLAVTLSTDDPAMFHTTLTDEYLHAAQLGLAPRELGRLAEMSFEAAFLPAKEKSALLADFRARRSELGLL